VRSIRFDAGRALLVPRALKTIQHGTTLSGAGDAAVAEAFSGIDADVDELRTHMLASPYLLLSARSTRTSRARRSSVHIDTRSARSRFDLPGACG